LGFPVSEEAMKLCQKLDKEQEKRDQNRRGMFICNDWDGWGISEMMENFVCCTAPRSILEIAPSRGYVRR
jgi:hypothetical protein